MATEKTCTKCNTVKPLSDYAPQERGLYGRHSQCKKCRNAQRKARYEANIESERASGRRNYWKNPEARKAYSRKRGAENRDDIREYNRQYYVDNKERENARKKKHYSENHEYYAQKAKERRLDPDKLADDMARESRYRKNNRPEISRKALKYHHKRYESNEEYRLKCNLRSVIRQAIRKGIAPKHATSITLLGCQIEDALKHLNGMGYNKELHDVDHVIPLARFDIKKEDHQMVAFNYMNIQPLGKSENRSKQDSLGAGWEEKLSIICSNIGVEYAPIYDYIKAGV